MLRALVDPAKEGALLKGQRVAGPPAGCVSRSRERALAWSQRSGAGDKRNEEVVSPAGI